MRGASYILSLILALPLLLSSCDATIHEYPDSTLASTKVSIAVDLTPAALHVILDNTVKGRSTMSTVSEWMAMQTKVASDYSMETLTRVVATRALEGWTVRLVWELYQQDKLIERGLQVAEAIEEHPVFELDMPLPAGSYTLLAWADYVPVGTDADYYYHTETLQYVRADRERRLSCLNNEERDCFCASIPIEVVQPKYGMEHQHFSGTLTRPQGRYVILSDDYQQYANSTPAPIEQSLSTITCPSFVNSAWNVLLSCPNDSHVGLTYTYRPMLYQFDGNPCAVVADDYSFVNGTQSIITTNISIVNQQSGYRSSYGNIEIPLYPNKLTVIIGNYLTSSSGAGGGFQISDNFDDEIVIQL